MSNKHQVILAAITRNPLAAAMVRGTITHVDFPDQRVLGATQDLTNIRYIFCPVCRTYVQSIVTLIRCTHEVCHQCMKQLSINDTRCPLCRSEYVVQTNFL